MDYNLLNLLTFSSCVCYKKHTQSCAYAHYKEVFLFWVALICKGMSICTTVHNQVKLKVLT
jgi:hypothetical protein